MPPTLNQDGIPIATGDEWWARLDKPGDDGRRQDDPEIAHLSDSALAAQIEEVDVRIEANRREAAAVVEAADAEGWTAGRKAAFDRHFAGEQHLVARAQGLRAERRIRGLRARVAEAARKPGSHEDAPRPAPKGQTPVLNPLMASRTDYLAAASEVIERAVLSPRRQDELDKVIRAEPQPIVARLLAAAGSDVYAAAFAKVIGDPQRAPFLLTDEERHALADATEAMRASSMSIGTPADGGFLLPTQLDPSIILSSEGSKNPMRRIAQVRTLVQKTLKVVTSDGVVAAYGAEGSDVAATKPDLLSPEIVAQRGTAYLEASFELFADWAGATSELTRLFADARDNLEADLFLNGTGVDEPQGLLRGLMAFDNAPTTVADLIAGQDDLPPRFQANARWLMSLFSINSIGQFVKNADASNASILDAQGNLLHKPVEEASYASTDVVYGDFRAGFAIGDRLGVSVEPIPVVYNKDTGVPSGKRALLMIWRSGSQILIPDAFRLLGAGGS